MAAGDAAALKQTLDALECAFEQPEADREGWLAALDASNPPLALRVRALLTAHASAQAAGFMREPLRLPLALPDAASALISLAPSDAIGPYRLVRELGAGGMGTVWLAERADGLFKRPVALKLPHVGPHAPGLAERFAREREILAALEHPHIARLYDAGITAAGQPYLAIEYVEGEALTRYCDARRLGLAARIGLFIDVLQAVQYAHGQLVVHRDLKPANILVTGDGRVKLLDFGIARLLADADAQQTSLTQVGGRALTPDYASPEQIMGRTIGTASDIYSLGVVLHELLVGQRPYRLKRDSPAALEDAIVAVDVQRPSDTEIARDAASARRSDPRRLCRQIRGDLDTVVLTAMAKAPAQRYTTCSAFAEDLQRHLDGRPLRAQPESRWRRGVKFVRRHRLGVAASAAVAIAVLTSAGVALVQAAKAREEAAVADAIRRFVVGVFERNSSNQPDTEKARATTARQLLDLGRDQLLLQSSSGEPAATQELLATFSELYNHLGLVGDAVQLDRARLALTRARFGLYDSRTLDAQRSLADSLLNEGSYSDEVLTLAQDAVAKLDRTGDHDSRLRARTEVLLAEAMSHRGVPGAFERQRQAVELMSRYSDDFEYPVLLANFARSQVARGDVTGARASIERGLQAWARDPARAKRLGAYVHGVAGQIYEANDDLRATEATLRVGLQMEHEIFSASWQRHLVWLRLCRLLQRTGRAAQAVAEGTVVLNHLRTAADVPLWFHVRAQSIVLQAAVEARDARVIDDVTASLHGLGCSGHDAFTEGLCRQALVDAHRTRGDLRAAAALLPDFEDHIRSVASSMPAAVTIDASTSAARAHLALGAAEKAGAVTSTAKRLLDGLTIRPILLDIRLGQAERDVLRARGAAAAAHALTERLLQRIAAHPDRELLAVYERSLRD